jgi:hypothetical protein
MAQRHFLYVVELIEEGIAAVELPVVFTHLLEFLLAGD